MSMHTPWGTPDSTLPIAGGSILVETPSHGGMRVGLATLEAFLSPLQMKYVRSLRFSKVIGEHVWFEEDCDMLIPLVALPMHAESFHAATNQEMPLPVFKAMLNLQFGRVHPDWPTDGLAGLNAFRA